MKRLVRILLFTLPLLLLIAGGCQTNRLGIVDYEVSVSSESRDASICAVQISDLHFKPGAKVNEQVIRAVREIRPDVIFFTGDMIDKKENFAAFAEFVGTLPKAPHMFAILGNWEYWSQIDLRELRKLYEANNINLLVNERSDFTAKGVSVRVVGLDDFLAGRPSTMQAGGDEGAVIILAHCPQLYDELRGYIPPKARGAVLSGHTHGGQVTLFGLPLDLPPGSAEYVAGLYHKDRFPLIVSKGVGTSVMNLRLFARPDISRIIMR